MAFSGCSIRVLGVYFRWIFLNRAQMQAVPNPAWAERGLQVNRPPGNYAKLNNICRSLVFEVSLLDIAQEAPLYEHRKLANVCSKHTLCIFPCN